MIRVATLDDAHELLAVCNQHELRVDPEFEEMPLSEIVEFLNGYEEPAHTLVLEDNGIKAVMFNPNLYPEQTMIGRIDRPEEYRDIASKCVSEFRSKNCGRALVILARQDEVQDQQPTAAAARRPVGQPPAPGLTPYS